MTAQKQKNSFLSWSYISALQKRLKRYIPSTTVLWVVFFATISTTLVGGISVFNVSPKYLLGVLILNMVFLLVLGLLLARRLVRMWASRQRGLAGSKLHVRITVLFGIVALVPAITMTVLSLLFFHFGVQDWFSNRIRSALSESVAVANSYLKEHQNNVAKDATLMAYDLNREISNLKKDRKRFDHYLTLMASLRSLTEAIVFNRDQDLLGRSKLTFALQFEPLPSWAVEQASSGKVALLRSSEHDRMRALIQLPGHPGVFLFVGRSVDPKVSQHLKRSAEIFNEYGSLEGQRTGFEIIVILLFSVVSLVLLLISLWVGVLISGRLIAPIQNLIHAAEKISVGDLEIRVPEKKKNQDDEMNLLSRSFNRMARRIQAQRLELLGANRELELQKQFIESTLAGVSVGVIGLDAKGKILYPNQMASQLLDIELNDKIGKKLSSVYMPLFKVFQKSLKIGKPFYEDQVAFQIRGLQRIFLVRILFEIEKKKVEGYVVTLDEITGLLDAQKQAAWADVARRVAHEIKNPLTPIHLAAERLKRKYSKEIKTSPDTFSECLETIKRQVIYIGNMVSEFSAFARMPKPVMKKENLSDIVHEVLSLHKNNKEINFVVDLPKDLLILCDAQQISQAILNVVKNGIEAMEDQKGGMKTISVSAEDTKKHTALMIEDTGPGFPEELQQNILDPYVTTKEKGTGLGLSIVKRIMEDHDGTLSFENQKGSKGARVVLLFTKQKKL